MVKVGFFFGLQDCEELNKLVVTITKGVEAPHQAKVAVVSAQIAVPVLSSDVPEVSTLKVTKTVQLCVDVYRCTTHGMCFSDYLWFPGTGSR